MIMNLNAEVNEIPYEKYGNLLQSRKLSIIRIRYDFGYVLVQDENGCKWKVVAKMTTRGYIAVLTKVDDDTYLP